MQIEVDFSRAKNRKFPEPVAIAIAKDKNGRYNPITLSWHMFTSHQPPMLAFSVGETRYSLEVIRAAKEFTVVFPSSDMAAAALLFGATSGRDCDKLSTAGLAVKPASVIDSRVIVDAAANFECTLVAEHVTGDHSIFVGEVVASHMNNDTDAQRLYTLGTGYKMGKVQT